MFLSHDGNDVQLWGIVIVLGGAGVDGAQTGTMVSPSDWTLQTCPSLAGPKI